MPLTGVLIVVFVVAGAALLAFGRTANRRRRSATHTWADTHGWTFTERDDAVLTGLTGPPFESGHTREASDVVTGTVEGTPVTAFEYHYSLNVPSSFADRQSAVFHRVVIARLAAPMASFSVTPAGVAARVGQALGFDDVTTGHERFDRSFRCHAPDPEAFATLLTDRRAELLLAHPVTLRSTGDRLVIVAPGRLRVSDADADLAFVRAFLDDSAPT